MAAFSAAVDAALRAEYGEMQQRELAYLQEHYTVADAYQTIHNAFDS